MDKPPRKRRLFSFSLRTLMVFMLLMCVLFGFVGMRVQRAREQQAFLTKLEASGWAMKFSDTPEFWELVIDNNYPDRIESVSYVSFATKDDENRLALAPALELKNLKFLVISVTHFSDLTPLVKLKNLKVLDVQNTQVSDQQIQKTLPDCEILR